MRKSAPATAPRDTTPSADRLDAARRWLRRLLEHGERAGSEQADRDRQAEAQPEKGGRRA